LGDGAACAPPVRTGNIVTTELRSQGTDRCHQGPRMIDHQDVASERKSTHAYRCLDCATRFPATLSACPACESRNFRVSRGRRIKTSDTVKLTVEGFLRKYRYYIIYIGGGLLIGALLRPVIIWLAAFSMPDGWLETREMAPFSIEGFFEPFWAAGKTLLRWGGQAVVGPVVWGYNMMLTHPSATILGLLGAVIGAFMAYRRRGKPRRRSRR
jgi:hypothetical protein